MTGVAFMGLGHWVGGACMIIGAYAASLLVVDRLYRVVKSKHTISWCATFAHTVQMKLARWRRRNVIEPLPSDAVIVSQIESWEAKLSP
jgi:hypothetical protein